MGLMGERGARFECMIMRAERCIVRSGGSPLPESHLDIILLVILDMIPSKNFDPKIGTATLEEVILDLPGISLVSP